MLSKHHGIISYDQREDEVSEIRNVQVMPNVSPTALPTVNLHPLTPASAIGTPNVKENTSQIIVGTEPQRPVPLPSDADDWAIDWSVEESKTLVTVPLEDCSN